MAPLEPEWLLWAQRLQIEHKSLLRRIDDLTQVTTQVGPLMERIIDLSARTHQSQAEYKLVREELSALGRSASKQKNEASVEMKKLRERIEDVEKELNRTIEPWEERMARSEILDEPKKHGINLRPRAASQAISQVTTTDESTSISEEADVRSRHASSQVLSMDSQGEMSLGAYFRYGEAFVLEAVELYEKRAVKGFVTGITVENLRFGLWERLDEVGWTWQKAREEIHKYIEGRRRRSKSNLGQSA